MRFFLILVLVHFHFSASASVIETVLSEAPPVDAMSKLIHAHCDSEVPTVIVKKIVTHESKSYYKGKVQPWPWAVNINGVGYYFPTEEAALAAAKKALSHGARRLGLGLGQIEWKYHKNRFENNLKASLRPDNNINVVCQILREGLNDKRVKSIRSLIAYYHRPVLDDIAFSYADKVLSL